jgi:hypothetical protein
MMPNLDCKQRRGVIGSVKCWLNYLHWFSRRSSGLYNAGTKGFRSYMSGGNWGHGIYISIFDALYNY